ncbi:response regulator transcription factor [Paenibacillus koleovorans]|uniref:response regulator transcription factor n=1 Tax=Paenibacillus koleovorans TaxID=121608 RepID=UPI000FD9CF6B|nr:response regulator transcription factor [Paenibacillus koleovorans]
MKVLVVEDELPLLESIVQLLREEGYEADGAGEGEEGLYYAESGIYDLLVLDIMMPGMSGLQLLQKLRAKSVDTPALLLTAKDSVEDRVRGLNTGADDYLVKPFAIPELLARVRALLRRKHPGSTGSDGSGSGGLSYDAIRLEPKLTDAYFGDQALQLTGKEYELLHYLIRNKEMIITREQLFDRVWGLDSEAGINLVDLYVHYVRKKLAAAGCQGWIQTVRGIGFMLRRK